MNKIILSLSGIAVVGIGSYLYFSNFNNENIVEKKIVQKKEILQKKEKTPRITTTYVKYIKPIKKKENGLEIVRGYKLPPEPDPKINNSTLLGVDSNNNMLRDDVERWIVQHDNWSDKRIAASLQAARGFQLTMDENFGSNELRSTYLSMNTDVLSVIKELEGHRPDLGEELDTLKMFELRVFNTPERINAYRKYDSSFGGKLVNGFPGYGKFAYKYADYSMEDGTLKSYKFKPEKYKTTGLIPLYSPDDGLIGSYWNLEKNDVQDFEGKWEDKFCEVNFGIPKNNIECSRKRRLHIEDLKKKGILK